MQEDKLIGNNHSPVENMEKVHLSPLTWINPASDTANAQNSGHLHVEDNSRDASNMERVDEKYEESPAKPL